MTSVIKIKHTYPIDSGKKPLSSTPINATITEPFTAGRAASRLLFDFGVMVSLMKQSILHKPVLDFGAGSGWVSEFCVRMGFRTVAFDIHGDLPTNPGTPYLFPLIEAAQHKLPIIARDIPVFREVAGSCLLLQRFGAPGIGRCYQGMACALQRR